MKTKRDGFIDFFKGILIIWVIHIHTVFWSGTLYLPEITRQISLLIDVPIFFFISGYLTKPTNFVPSFQKSARQFINLYFNYLIISCILICFLYLTFSFQNKTIPNLPLAIISMLQVHPHGELWEMIIVYPKSLWYIRVYLSLLFLVPLVMSFIKFRRLRLILLTFVILIFSFSLYLNWNYDFLFTQTIYINFYLFIYLLGVLYQINEQNIPIHLLIFTFLFNIILILIIFHHDGNHFQIQTSKFPPSLKYLIYSLMVIHIFTMTKRIWHYSDSVGNHQVFQNLEWCGRNVYFIYLFQGVVCSLPFYFIPIIRNHVPPLTLYFIILTFNVPCTLFITFVYLKLKVFSLNLFNKIVINIENPH
jgi:fucose 4-O-acetylase-like acetyltransferase